MKKIIFAIVLAVVLPLALLSNNAFAATSSTNTLLYKGMWSSKVTALQNNLRSLGYFNYKATGYFGTHTKQSVENYQRTNNLYADGIVGAKTQREIYADKMLKKADAYIGVPYVWGGTTPSGFDCSGFTKYIFNNSGISLPRTAALQYNAGYTVPRSQLKSGDLVFFSTYKAGPSHVGIYTSNNQFIGASSSLGIAKIDLNNSYYAQRYIGAKRIIS